MKFMLIYISIIEISLNGIINLISTYNQNKGDLNAFQKL